MAPTLSLELSDAIYKLLAQTAEQTQQPLEELSNEWLAKAGRQIESDPLDKYIGAFTGGIPNWTDRHYEYIGASLMDTHESDDHEAT